MSAAGTHPVMLSETNQSLAPALMNPKIHGLHLINRIITIINRDLYAAYDCLYQKMISGMIDGWIDAHISDRDAKCIIIIWYIPTISVAETCLDHSNFLITSSLMLARCSLLSVLVDVSGNCTSSRNLLL